MAEEPEAILPKFTLLGVATSCPAAVVLELAAVAGAAAPVVPQPTLLMTTAAITARRGRYLSRRTFTSGSNTSLSGHSHRAGCRVTASI